MANRRALGRARVLVWEQAETRALTPRLLRLGCEVRECTSVEHALELNGDRGFDLILASPGNANDDQVGMLRLLRRALPGPALVLISTEALVAVRLRCQDLRPQYFATLPLDDAELHAILHSSLGQRSR